MWKKKFFYLATLLLGCVLSCRAANYEISSITPPKPDREFRGLWIATVANIDWPSKPGLSTAAQKAELNFILDRAAQLNLNAVIFQVRPACDAFYPSSLEPWSEYLTGTMGKAPSPFYDPLAFAIEGAHQRGLELHAWFNPYRALHKSHEGTVSQTHISKTHPNLVKHYGQYLWLDPGEREVQEHSLNVVMDVVKRYDIDGVHFDDYFYPDRADSPTKAEFPDEASWKKYGATSSLNFEDWRRENVNTFIQRCYQSIKSTKPWVKFGVSPHGIWRPGNPPQIQKGFDAYGTIYADSRKWLANGWVDYFSPQLYWRIEPRETSFPVLLEWWAQQNVKERHLWPGLSVANAFSQKWESDEIPNQIGIARRQKLVDGYLFYNTSTLLMNSPAMEVFRQEVARRQPHKALIPASPWLGNNTPAKPKALVVADGGQFKLTWNSSGTNSLRWWVIQTEVDGNWDMEVLPAKVSSKVFPVGPQVIAVTAIDHFGNASAPRVLQRKSSATRKP